MKKRYFEFHDSTANSHKFYSVEPVPGSIDYIVRWGRIGTTGQQQLVTELQAAERVSDKMSKGYREIDSADARKLSERANPKPIRPAPTKSAFLEALAEIDTTKETK